MYLHIDDVDDWGPPRKTVRCIKLPSCMLHSNIFFHVFFMMTAIRRDYLNKWSRYTSVAKTSTINSSHLSRKTGLSGKTVPFLSVCTNHPFVNSVSLTVSIQTSTKNGGPITNSFDDISFPLPAKLRMIHDRLSQHCCYYTIAAMTQLWRT